MAYIVKYIQDFSQIEAIKEICVQDQKAGYTVAVFGAKRNRCDLGLSEVETHFCDCPKPSALSYAKEKNAEKCQFYMKKDGIYTVDPKRYSIAKKLKELDYDEFLEMSVNGYTALEHEIIEKAKRNSIRLEILSLYNPVPTLIKEVVELEGKTVKSIIKDSNIAVVTLTEIPDKKGITYKIFNTLSDNGIYVDSIMLPAANHAQQDISFSVKVQDKQKTEMVLKQQKSLLEYQEIIINDNVAKVSVIGTGIQMRCGVAAKLLEVLYQNDINVMMIFSTEIKISIVMEKSKSDLAVREIHKCFIQ